MTPPLSPDNSNRHAEPCPRCGSAAGLVWVHGHGQCVACGSNVDECCQGAACDLAPPRAADR